MKSFRSDIVQCAHDNLETFRTSACRELYMNKEARPSPGRPCFLCVAVVVLQFGMIDTRCSLRQSLFLRFRLLLLTGFL